MGARDMRDGGEDTGRGTGSERDKRWRRGGEWEGREMIGEGETGREER